MAQPLRVGMVGAGWVSQHHLRGWARQAGRAEVVAIADPSEAALRARAAEFGVPGAFPSAEAMLAAQPLDLLDICAPREFHADLVRLAARHGLPTLCQKPLAPDLAQAERLVAEVGSAIRLMVHENWRFRDYYRRIRQWLEAGSVGAVRQVHLEFLSSGMIPGEDGQRPAVARQPFLREVDRLLVTEVLIHHLDTLRFLFGEMDVLASRLARTSDEIAGEDAGTILLESRGSGAPVSIVASMAVHGAPAAPTDRLRVFGQEGTIELDGGSLALTGRTQARESFDLAASYGDSYARVIAHFLDRLQDGGPFETSPEDNLETLRLVEDVYLRAGPPRAPGRAQSR